VSGAHRNPNLRRSHPFATGLVALALVCLVSYLGFTKDNPLNDKFQVKAAFRTVNDLKPKSAVRIAGVNVGKVKSVEHARDGGGHGAIVTIEFDDKALPLHEDTTMKVRPRIFLEGNYFVDVKPGSPSAPVLKSGDTIPVQQTAAPVQLGNVLAALQSDTREDLRRVLREYGKAVNGEGGRAFNRSLGYQEGAFRDSAIVNEATLGLEEHDLSGYLDGARRVAKGLDRSPAALKSLIESFYITADAFAREQRNLSAAINELPRTLSQGRTTLRKLNGAFPAVRRFIPDARAASRSSKPALEATLPFVKQMRRLFSRPELRGLVTDLDPLVPELTELNRGGVGLNEQQRALSSCGANVIVPWQDDTVPDPNFPATGPIYQDSIKWLPGIAAESRSYDAHGQYVRTLAKTANFAVPAGEGFYLTDTPVQGVNPPPTKESRYRPDVPCETQERPDLRTQALPVPNQIRINQNAPGAAERRKKADEVLMDWMRDQMKLVGWDKRLKLSKEPLKASELDDLRRTLGKEAVK
jgi:phospholipid/cholesterol/gamma-HCH transport system substrate-binding protein